MASMIIQQVKSLANINLDSAGSAQALTESSTPVRSITIVANPSNTGTIWVGDSNVNASASRGTPLAAGEAAEITPDRVRFARELMVDLADVYIDGDTTNDDVSVVYILDKETFN